MYKIFRIFVLGTLIFNPFSLKSITCYADEINNTVSTTNIVENSTSSSEQSKSVSEETIDSSTNSTGDSSSSEQNKSESEEIIDSSTNSTGNSSSSEQNETKLEESNTLEHSDKTSSSTSPAENRWNTLPPLDDSIPIPWKVLADKWKPGDDGGFSIWDGALLQLPDRLATIIQVNYTDAIGRQEKGTLNYRKLEVIATGECEITGPGPDKFSHFCPELPNGQAAVDNIKNAYLDKKNNKLVYEYSPIPYYSQSMFSGGFYGKATGEHDVIFRFSFANGQQIEKSFHNFFFKSTDPSTASVVVVKYVDTDGNSIYPADILRGKLNDAYQTEPKKIEGYTLFQTPENASGTFTKDYQTVTYVYKKDQVDPPEQPDLPEQLSAKISVGKIQNNKFRITIENFSNVAIPFKNVDIYNSGSKLYIPPIKSAQWKSPNLGDLKIKIINGMETLIQPTKNDLQLPANTKNVMWVTLNDDYQKTLPKENYTSYFSLETGNHQIDYSEDAIFEKRNFFGLYKEPESPQYYIQVPSGINFNDRKREEDISLELLDKSGNPYTGAEKIRVTVSSDNDYKLVDPNIPKKILYSIMYGGKEVNNSSNLVAVLSQQNPKVQGIAKLLETDDTNGNHYYDKLTYSTSVVTP